MASFRKLEEIECWKLARELAKEIWIELNNGTLAKDYSLRNQMNRSSGSIMDNIAEGYGRGGNKEFVNFLSIGRGSGEELKSQLCRCADRKHIPRERLTELYNLNVRVCVKINNLMEYLKRSGERGQKWKK